jgi:hypothetical protein
MIVLGVSQAQAQFTQLLNQSVLIVDKKSHRKKAVILPYDDYLKLIQNTHIEEKELGNSNFSKFVGILDNDFKTDDTKYNKIVK